MTKRSTILLLILALVLAACSEDGKKSSPDAGPDSGPDGGDNTLALGEVFDLVAGANGAFEATIETPAGDEEYVLLLASLARNPLESYTYTVEVDGQPLGEPEETGPIADSLPFHAPPPGWSSAVEAVRAGASMAVPSKDPPPDVGEFITLSISNGTTYEDISCEVMMVTDALVVVFDRTTDPEMTIDAEILAEFSDNFGQIVLPRERIYFGQESDVNQDEHVTLLFSPLVYTGSGGATAYVHPCDLLEPGAPGCMSTNEQELIYISPPDMLEEYMASAKAITETVAHEFQHAIYFYRKYVLNDATEEDESAYVTEGMSAMAQDISGFQAGNLYVAAAGIEQVNDVSLAAVVDYPFGYDPTNDGVYRGAAYLILRYAFDQAGGDEIDGDGTITDLGGITFLNEMTDVGLFGYDGVENAAGEDADVLFFDFYTAMLLDDREKDGELINDDPRYRFGEPWDDPITENPHGITMNYDLADGMWEVRGVPIQQGGADGDIKPGGAEYILITATGAGETLTIGASSIEAALLAARLVRIY
jgi:hypothetical protein